MLLVFEFTPTSKDINSPSTVTKETALVSAPVCVSLREQNKTKQNAPKAKEHRNQTPTKEGSKNLKN
jgi:hypothetical protein